MPPAAAPRMSARGRLLIPVVVALIVQVPVTFFDVRTRVGERPVVQATSLGELWLPLLVALIGPVALLFARRHPGPVVAITAAAAAADLLLFESRLHPPYIALAFAIVSSVVRGARLWAWISVAAAWLLAFGLAALLHRDPSPPRVAALTLGVLIVMGIAEALRTRVDRSRERARDADARKSSELQLERVRIARELHDVLAHSLSQINVQAGVGLHLMDRQPEKAREALANIKESSRTALQEVRGVLGFLRAEAEADPSAPLTPVADLATLPALVASMRSQGLEVILDNAIEQTPSTGVQLALYRIVQESLTNVLRHASRVDSAAISVDIRLSERDTDYQLTITDNGDGVQNTHPDSGGRGLLGMTERAALLGGSLNAQSRPAGGFRVSARLPKDGATP